MRCGAKRFLAKIKINDEQKTIPVIARTPAGARKAIRKKYGVDTFIISVIEQRNVDEGRNHH